MKTSCVSVYVNGVTVACVSLQRLLIAWTDPWNITYELLKADRPVPFWFSRPPSWSRVLVSSPADSGTHPPTSPGPLSMHYSNTTTQLDNSPLGHANSIECSSSVQLWKSYIQQMIQVPSLQQMLRMYLLLLQLADGCRSSLSSFNLHRHTNQIIFHVHIIMSMKDGKWGLVYIRICKKGQLPNFAACHIQVCE